MKYLLLAFSILSTQVAFSQSFLIMKTGKVLTLDEQGMVYDLGNFLLPYQIKTVGGRYLIDENRRLRTVDRNGLMYNKEKEDKVPVKIEYYGENFFISKFGKMYTVDESGFIFAAEKEREFRNIKLKGGNFVIAEKKVESEKKLALYVVNNLGQIIEVTNLPVDLNLVNYVGGQYFTTTRGELFSVSNDGFVYSKKELGKFNGYEMKKGSNYFVVRDSLYTVAQSGIVASAGTNNEFAQIRHFGTNFFVTNSGALYTISSTGNVRQIPLDYKLSDISVFSQL